MRPVRLEMKNFGPYRETAIVDFTKLDSLFLICGPTGSGKSTIFDAMTYALYGALPGAKNSMERQLVSHYAPPGEAPFVKFDFALGAALYRVERRPPYERAKRGGGRIEAPPEAALLRQHNGEWQPVADKISDTTARIVEHIGLTLDEFSKIILLPQGEFQKFLDMNATERVTVLEKLFPVELHGAVTELAAAQAADCGAQVKALDADLARYKEELAQDADGQAGETQQSPEQKLILLRQTFSKLHASLEEARISRTRLEGDLAREEQRALRLEKARAAAAALAALQAEEEAAQTRKAHIAGAQAARRALAPILEAGRRQDEALSAAATYAAQEQECAAIAARAASIEGLIVDIRKNEQDILLNEKELAISEQAVAAWDTVQELHTSQAAAAKTEAAAQMRAQKAALQAQDLAKAYTDEKPRLAEETAARAGLETARLEYVQAEKMLEQAQNIRQAARVLAAQHDEAVRLAAEVEQAEKHSATTRLAMNTAERSLHANLAARLRAGLREGEPCPVCGSLAHAHNLLADSPDSDSNVDAQARLAELKLQFERASKAEAACGERAREAARKAAQARVDLDMARESFVAAYPALASSPDCANADICEQLCKKNLSGCATIVSDAKKTVEHIDARNSHAETIQLAHEAAQKEAEQARADYVEIREASTIIQAKLEAAALQAGTENPYARNELLKTAIETAKRARDQAQAEVEAWKQAQSQATLLLHEAKKRCVETRAAADGAQKQALHYCRTEGFDSIEGAQASVLSHDELRFLEEAAASWDKSFAESTARAAALSCDLLGPGEEEPDPGALRMAVEAAQARIAMLDIELDAARASVDRLASLLTRIAQAQARREALGAEASSRTALAALLKGELPGRKLPFKNFVLDKYFRYVVLRASARLSEMSAGRYTLVADEGSASGRGKLGLNILVFDAYTGRSRPTATLSGGERFLTSISLAFGLSDTIRARSGGVNLDAVFIDEGFGSLDEETLDTAITVLDRLRGARMIGIVSHVAELRARIPSRIDVEKTSSGSRLRIAG